MNREELLAAAREAALHAYAPYSKFRVGAALVVRTEQGEQLVTGANVENASYSLTLCAERAALATAMRLVPPGAKLEVSQLAVTCLDVPDDAPANQRTPCGACRQWFAELAPKATFYVDGIPQDLTLDDLLPLAFVLDE